MDDSIASPMKRVRRLARTRRTPGYMDDSIASSMKQRRTAFYLFTTDIKSFTIIIITLVAHISKLEWVRHFMTVVRRLITGGLTLALFLLIESQLENLARGTLHRENNTVSAILDGIEIGSAVSVAVLFLIHSIAICVQYIQYLYHED